jgi:PhzF family phenazine biosynthesis protein
MKIFQVDAFTDNLFTGNPAAVVPLDEWLPDRVMQQIAAENNLSETAFYIPSKNGFAIRWFTPETEVNLCGHATLATAHVIFNHMGFEGDRILFESRSGTLFVRRDNGLLQMNFPASPPSETEIPEGLASALGKVPLACFKGGEDLLALFESEEEIRSLVPRFEKLKILPFRGIIVTAPGKEADFVSRFFGPAVGVNEDPVTGSAHTVLIPFWAERLNKEIMVARQVSKRGGVLYCTNQAERVFISGHAITYLNGEIFTGF